jgi:hypothetical protein
MCGARQRARNHIAKTGQGPATATSSIIPSLAESHIGISETSVEISTTASTLSPTKQLEAQTSTSHNLSHQLSTPDNTSTNTNANVHIHSDTNTNTKTKPNTYTNTNLNTNTNKNMNMNMDMETNTNTTTAMTTTEYMKMNTNANTNTNTNLLFSQSMAGSEIFNSYDDIDDPTEFNMYQQLQEVNIKLQKAESENSILMSEKLVLSIQVEELKETERALKEELVC